jgi:hypothetical protein
LNAGNLTHKGPVMIRARRVSVRLLIFGLLYFAGGSALAAIPEDSSAGLRAASASVTTQRILGQRHLPMVASVSRATSKSRVFKSQVGHPSSVHLARQHEQRQQTSDLYTPSHSSHLLLLHYPLWFQFGPATNYSKVSAQRVFVRAPLTAL